jgi:hypothetical protein
MLYLFYKTLLNNWTNFPEGTYQKSSKITTLIN